MLATSRCSSKSSLCSNDEHEGSSGEKQSPINITKEIIDYDPTLKSSKLKFSYTLGDAKTVEITPNGFSCKIKENGTSTLAGCHLPAVYRFREFHGHWGATEEDGSEHRLNGRAFSGELHFMFWNPKYNNYEQCLREPDGVAILAVFVLMDAEDNEHFVPFLNAVEESMAMDAPAELPKDFDFSRLLPDKLHYYTYEGSLTVPPFPECAIWTVLHRSIPLGMSQLDVLRTVVGDNAREMQAVYARRVRSSFKAVLQK